MLVTIMQIMIMANLNFVTRLMSQKTWETAEYKNYSKSQSPTSWSMLLTRKLSERVKFIIMEVILKNSKSLTKATVKFIIININITFITINTNITVIIILMKVSMKFLLRKRWLPLMLISILKDKYLQNAGL